jgi:site-specific DNA-cytosine methylase
MCRVIAESKPTYVLGENVAGIVTMELDRVLSDLENLGYAAWPLVIPACAVDARHRRDRVWILGANTDLKPGTKQKREHQRAEDHSGSGSNELGAGEIVADSEHEGRHAAALNRKSQGNDSGQTQPKKQAEQSSGGDAVADTNSAGCEEQRRAIANGAEHETAECGNRWEPESGVGLRPDGLSSRLDKRGLTMLVESHRMISLYGEKKKIRPEEILRLLRNGIEAEGVQWTAGRSERISADEILLSFLRKLEENSTTLEHLSLSGAETLKGGVRSLRTGHKPSRASSRSKHQQQCAGEYPDTLQTLSRLLAQHSQKAWQMSRWQDASTLPWGDGWEVGTPRVADGIPNRAHRLRGLGNAIVPQVAQEIIRVMIQTGI